MNFFEHQAKAHSNSKKLILLFLLAIIAIIAAVYFPIQWLMFDYFTKAQDRAYFIKDSSIIWSYSLFWKVALGTLAIIFIGSYFKIRELSEGGCVIAHMMNGRLVDPETQDFKERQLLNVVEEMSIAAGIPVPNVYLLDRENTINAFAAGYTMGDAVIGVTRGTIEKLKREELQGVIAHEFSHILNGDMRLNIKLLGLLHGILVIGLIGRALVSSKDRSSSRRHGKGSGPLILLGLALMVIGWIGYFFGRLIQAAVSRQREFLADASAVQYTRNTDGIGGALKKIAGYGDIPAAGSHLFSSRRDEISHMTFGSVHSSSGWTSSHPPIETRIMAIDRGFRPEQHKKISPLPDIISHAQAQIYGKHDRKIQVGDMVMPVSTKLKYTPDMVSSLVGTIHVAAIDTQRKWLDDLNLTIRQACHHPVRARALIFVLLAEFDENKRQTFQDILKIQDPYVLESFEELWNPVKLLGSESRLKLVDLSLPALRRLNDEDHRLFIQTLLNLITADQNMSLFEFLLMKTVRRHLKNHKNPKRVRSPFIHNVNQVEKEIAVLLSAIASPNQTPIKSLDKALKKLVQTTFEIRRQVMEACAQAILLDQIATWKEREMLRIVGDSLDCPIPYLAA